MSWGGGAHHDAVFELGAPPPDRFGRQRSVESGLPRRRRFRERKRRCFRHRKHLFLADPTCRAAAVTATARTFIFQRLLSVTAAPAPPALAARAVLEKKKKGAVLGTRKLAFPCSTAPPSMHKERQCIGEEKPFFLPFFSNALPF